MESFVSEPVMTGVSTRGPIAVNSMLLRVSMCVFEDVRIVSALHGPLAVTPLEHATES